MFLSRPFLQFCRRVGGDTSLVSESRRPSLLPVGSRRLGGAATTAPTISFSQDSVNDDDICETTAFGSPSFLLEAGRSSRRVSSAASFKSSRPVAAEPPPPGARPNGPVDPDVYGGPKMDEKEEDFVEPPTAQPQSPPSPTVVLTVSEWKPRLTLRDSVSFLKRERRIPKNDLSSIFDLRLRDLRSLTLDNTDGDDDFRDPLEGVTSRYSSILVRPSAIIVHLESLQAVIKSDRVFFFNTTSPLMQRALANFPIRIRGTLPTNPFELRVLEALLVEYVDDLDRQFNRIEPELTELLDSLLKAQSPPMFQRLHDLSNTLSSFEDRVNRTRRVFTELLNSNEDMAGMFLQRVHPTEEHEEAELLLENFLIAVTQEEAKVALLRRQIISTENYIKIHFDGQRNRLIRMNLIISFCSLSMSTGAFGAGIFGMNLINGLETHPHGFAIVTAGISFMAASSFAATYAFYHNSKQSPVDHRVSFRPMIKPCPEHTVPLRNPS